MKFTLGVLAPPDSYGFAEGWKKEENIDGVQVSFHVVPIPSMQLHIFF
jgi:hypothetical protein